MEMLIFYIIAILLSKYGEAAEKQNCQQKHRVRRSSLFPDSAGKRFLPMVAAKDSRDC